ncbi:thiamine-phosphate kinase [Mariprofundus sp. EBB-1]|uniref:thiamine-phosphate kinase n=1 Tax=Mariprofundus sp. EBB-1 TaxID=2650971 RepID=UPI000EF1913D|nr:thiamine-phosphate kinase [Mariprofundus sp. EBB-1]RLL51898.1 thiamine-phosphate kinase [Mariprofundus sp. EBB-1]
MAEGEFKLINRLFKGAGGSAKGFTSFGIGDDGSIHKPTAACELVVSTDSSVQNVHWPDDFSLDKAADRAVCSALSDLAAMGAEPVCVWLNVMAVDSTAVELLGQGATAALRRYDVELAGGDTSKSATNAVSVTVAGELPAGSAMRRDGAKTGDVVWLCGKLGFHAAGLKQWFDKEYDGLFIQHFETLTPQLQAGIALRERGIACCIDVSDGLLQDAEHICHASKIGMELEINKVPDWAYLSDQLGESAALNNVMQGGEDYALLFTAPAHMAFPDELALKIGHCRQKPGVALLLNGKKVDIGSKGYDHFS